MQIKLKNGKWYQVWDEWSGRRIMKGHQIGSIPRTTKSGWAFGLFPGDVEETPEKVRIVVETFTGDKTDRALNEFSHLKLIEL